MTSSSTVAFCSWNNLPLVLLVVSLAMNNTFIALKGTDKSIQADSWSLSSRASDFRLNRLVIVWAKEEMTLTFQKRPGDC